MEIMRKIMRNCQRDPTSRRRGRPEGNFEVIFRIISIIYRIEIMSGNLLLYSRGGLFKNNERNAYFSRHVLRNNREVKLGNYI